MNIKYKIAVSLAVLSLLAAGCGNSYNNASNSTYPTPTATQKNQNPSPTPSQTQAPQYPY